MYPVKYFLNTDYQEMELLGVKGLFSNLRVERESLPDGFYKYSIREGDEDFFSTVEPAVLVNHAGDFICKEKIDFGASDYIDVGEDYNFTGEDVDLNEFFGVDLLDKVAETLDEFMANIAPYEYSDNLKTGQSNMVDEIRAMLNDREQLAGIINELTEINDETKFADVHDQNTAQWLLIKLNDVLRDLPEQRPKLDVSIANAQSMRAKKANGEQKTHQEATRPD